ncbi:hypothetical protein EOM89_02415 [Candidatus Falkowbacteria bacterium]|nr:hypothetical protein [Candidatus Falkowbacteria bacterium]
MKSIIDLVPKRTKILPPEDYLGMTPADRANVKSSRFVPPTVGSDDFGMFIITLKNPTYCLADGKE